ncbi:hypothetical protein H6G76_35605 [Nostoc sp. FACHB-152]|uniref:hypothetical protein n=1 Tax=unclassified Nostoc TaxID=2593658 RepID=UPI001685349F|nr:MULTISPECIES: hypothetical protein [unclassified Nostoc]MBD2452338.1 hypothetical protein [Nostoc sp. FACHB-152]MBD2472310.1 hypothetical protein [Nostoc sp. FACHB-145]
MDKPILEKDGTKSEGEITIQWYVAVHPHPLDQKKYSYAIAIDNVLERNPSPIADFDSCLFGCYETAYQALNAAVEEANQIVVSQKILQNS